MGNVVAEDRLLSLAKAARLLGVHPTTLRRWADQGDILVMTTPGGHRRFPQTEIDRIKGTGVSDSGATTDLVQQALMHSRKRLVDHAQEAWLQKIHPTERGFLRSMGHEVLALLKEFLDNRDSDNTLQGRIDEMGQRYGRYTKKAGLQLGELLQATSFFRDSTLESAIDTADTNQDTFRDRFRSINSFFNRLLVAASTEFETSAS